MRIEIVLTPHVSTHLRELVLRDGLHIVRLGSGYRVLVGNTLLGAEEVIVRVEEDAAQLKNGAEE
jgi:hypothetical protein